MALFTRRPVPGATKTRLVPPLSHEQAASLQRAMAEDLLERLAVEFASTTDLELRLTDDPESGERSPLEVPRPWRIVAQGPGDLGARLRRATRDAGRDRVPRLALIGADAPLLPASLIESAFAALGRADCALSPAADGGYVLLALATAPSLTGRHDPLFASIPWGSEAVAAATRSAASAAGLRLITLPAHRDVDRAADLRLLARTLDQLPGEARPPRTAAALARFGLL